MPPSANAIEVSATPDLIEFLDATAKCYAWEGPEEAALRLLDAACAFFETTQSAPVESLTPNPAA